MAKNTQVFDHKHYTQLGNTCSKIYMQFDKREIIHTIPPLVK